MELADQQNLDAEGAVTGAEIPVLPETDASPASSAPEKPLSLRETINKSVEAVRKEEATRARDTTTGKFAKIEASAAEKPATAEIPKPEQNATPADSKPAAPPSEWKGVWEKLPPEAQAIAIKRAAEVEKGFEEYRTKTAQFTEISQALEPLRPMLQQQGIQSDAQAVKTLLQWEKSFRDPQTRTQAFHNLARQYGVDLSTLAQNPPQAPSAAQDSIPDPIRPVLDQFGNRVANLETQLQRAEEGRISQELSSFAKDKPHFEKVRVIMGQLMNSGIVTPGDLEGAYQKATALHPEVSAQIASEAAKKTAEELARTQAEKANKARLAAVSPAGRSPNGAPTNGTAQKPKSSVRDAILASVKELAEGQRA